MKNNIHSLSDLKRSYEKLWSERDFIETQQYYRWIADLLKSKPKQKILDVGCGAGYFLIEAEKKQLICYGIDIAENAIKIASKRCKKSDLQQGVAERLPYKDKFFHRVVCLGSLEHFFDIPKSLSEMRRVMKDNGMMCIVIPNKWSLNDIMRGIVYGLDQDHGQELERFFTYNEAVELFTNAGLQIVQVYGYNQPTPAKIRTGTLLSFIADAMYFFGYRIFRWHLPVRISYSFVFLLRKST